MLDIKRGQRFAQPNGDVGDQGIKQSQVIAQVVGCKIPQGSLTVRLCRPVKRIRPAKLLHPLLFGFVVLALALEMIYTSRGQE